MHFVIPAALRDSITLIIQQLKYTAQVVDSYREARAIQKHHPDFNVALEDIASEFERQAIRAGLPLLMSRGESLI
jgi:hypothetical protein